MDVSISRALDGFALRHDGFEDVLRAYVLASEYVFLALVAALVLSAVLGGQPLTRAVGIIAGASAAVALLVGKLISDAVDRPRPFVTHPGIHDFLAHAPDPGMPSDHATAAFAIGTAILIAHRRAGAAILVGATVLALGRVFLGVHYLSDVAVGAALGSSVAVLVTIAARRLPEVALPLPRPPARTGRPG
jgi:undecaprenyl-diphosphatase